MSNPPFTDLPSAYARAGVDIDAAADAVGRMKAHIAATRAPGILSDAVGSFGGLFSLKDAGISGGDPVLVSSIDGVGTKLKIAFATGRHDTIGRDLVFHCANDILVQGARALFFLDYFATGRLEPGVAEQVVKGLADGCREIGCVLIGGETAEMPGMYQSGEYDLAGCIIGVVDRARLIDASAVRAGDVLIGLASDGLHTNGYSLARHALLETAGYALDAPAPDLNASWGEALLWPHRCYAAAVLPLLGESGLIHAMAHITGGGFTDNIPRSLPEGLGAVVRRAAWAVPPLFTHIQKAGGISETEMLRVFNMGIGFVLIAPPERADEIIARVTASGERASLIGEVVAGAGVAIQ